MDKSQPLTVAEFVHRWVGSCREPGLIATDMDGTLTHQGQFSAGLLQGLAHLHRSGWMVVVVTGRSAGWVQGLAHYLPIAGAMAENGGVYLPRTQPLEYLTAMSDLSAHRQALGAVFQDFKRQWPFLHASPDNAFRLTDWTFDIHGLTPTDLTAMARLAHDRGWGFTYSTVQCHLFPQGQSKAVGLRQMLERHFPQVTLDRVITIGDSPNDVSLFDPQVFPHSVGVANVNDYWLHLAHHPRCVTHQAEGDGFLELATALLEQTG